MPSNAQQCQQCPQCPSVLCLAWLFHRFLTCLDPRRWSWVDLRFTITAVRCGAVRCWSRSRAGPFRHLCAFQALAFVVTRAWWDNACWQCLAVLWTIPRGRRKRGIDIANRWTAGQETGCCKGTRNPPPADAAQSNCRFHLLVLDGCLPAHRFVGRAMAAVAIHTMYAQARPVRRLDWDQMACEGPGPGWRMPIGQR